MVFSLICVFDSTLTAAFWTLWPHITGSCFSNAGLSGGFQVICVLSISSAFAFHCGRTVINEQMYTHKDLKTQLISFWIILISFGGIREGTVMSAVIDFHNK